VLKELEDTGALQPTFPIRKTILKLAVVHVAVREVEVRHDEVFFGGKILP
jgi:hypothetical protein